MALPNSLAQYLAGFPGQAARVTMTLHYDPGHGSQTRYAMSVLAPTQILNPTSQTDRYTYAITDGHPLNPSGTRNKLVITAPATNPAATDIVTFDLLLNGTQLGDKDGQPYIFALAADGPDIPIYPAEGDQPANNWHEYFGLRGDLISGNEGDVEDTPQLHHIRSSVGAIDITLVGVQGPPLTARLGTVRSHFTPRYPTS